MKGLVSGLVTETVEPSVGASGLTRELEGTLLPEPKPLPRPAPGGCVKGQRSAKLANEIL